MAVRFNFYALILAGFLTAACAEDGRPQSPDDEDDDSTASANRRKDAGRAPDDDDEEDLESEDADETTDEVEADDEDDRSASSDESSQVAERSDAGSSDAGRKGDETSSGASCDTLTYEDFGMAFAEKYCARAGCHDSDTLAGDVDLTSLEGFQMLKDYVEYVAVMPSSSGRYMMPPSGEMPTAAEREQLGQWLDCGPQ